MILSNRYVITESLPGGGMGDVVVCTDQHLERKVVIKTLKPGQEDRRLTDERRALLKLRSKHVVQLYDLIQIPSGSATQHAIVLEFIEGADLAPGSTPDVDLHLKIIWQIACGLAAIHEQGIIHRDIKPNNIRIDNEGVVKILDFGLARAAGVEAKTMSAIGTPGFMAPELWSNSGVSFDQSIDTYAFAATAIALRVGTLPPELMSWPPQPVGAVSIRSLLADCPDDIIELLTSSLHHIPGKRPRMGDIECAIRRHLLKGRHRGLFVLGTKVHEVNSTAHTATITSQNRGTIAVKYDGLRFSILNVTGTVKINNLPAAVGSELPACCVITFENATSRAFVTFDVSNPEVVS